MTLVTPDIPERKVLLQNYYRVAGVYGAIWIIFHLVSVFFFGFIVGSPLLVGIFLGIGNIWAMCIDVPLSTLQRQISAKTMLAIANSMMIAAVIGFLYLTLGSSDLGISLDGTIWEMTTRFLGTGINILLLAVIGILYGSIKEVYDITTLSYLLNHADPEDYDRALSKNNIAQGIGSVIGIVLAVIILSFRTDSVQLILFFLLLLIVAAWVFIQLYFDNSHDTFRPETVTHLTIIDTVKNIEKQSEETIRKTLSTVDFQTIKNTMDYVLIKPREIARGYDWKELGQKTKQEYQTLYKLVFGRISFVPILLWSTGSIILFGCWDTIVTTFFIDFLDQALRDAGVKNIIRSGFILIGILAIPAYMMQGFWISQSRRYGIFTIIVLGLAVSGGALIGLGIFGSMENLTGLVLVMCMGLANSSGYAAGYPMSQSVFAEQYSQAYARVNQTTIVSADVAAAPMKILNNFANAVGLICGGALITLIGFTGMFLVYGAAVTLWGYMSLRKKGPWKLG